MKLYDVKQNGDCLTIRRTTSGRLAEAASRLATWWPLVFAAEAIFFLPDYLHRYRDGASDERFVFWAALAGLATLIAGIGAIVKFVRRDTWIIDPDRGKLVFQTRPFFGARHETEVDLDRLVGLRYVQASPPRLSELSLHLRGQPDETLCRTRWGSSMLDDVVDAIQSFADTHSLALEFERTT
jgi:hypothetical protein